MKNLSKRQKAILDCINIKKEISTTEILAFIKQTFEGGTFKFEVQLVVNFFQKVDLEFSI